MPLTGAEISIRSGFFTSPWIPSFLFLSICQNADTLLYKGPADV
jgi:hypothetical protein